MNLSNSPQPEQSKQPGKLKGTSVQKILSTGGVLMVVLLSLLLGLAIVIRSLRNVKIALRLKLKRDDRAEKKY